MNRPAKTELERTARLRSSSRHGVAAVEFAICLPVLMAMVFGMIEASNAVFLKEALTAAAYESANCASAVGGTSAVATDRGKAVLTLLGVNSGTIAISPVVTTNTPTGTTIVVTCSAPLSANTSTGWSFGNITLTAHVTVSHL